MEKLLEKLEGLTNRQEKFKEKIKNLGKSDYKDSSDKGLKESLALVKEYIKIKSEINILMKEVERLEAII